MFCMPLVNEVDVSDFEEMGHNRVGRLRSYEVSVTLDDQCAFLYHEIKAYFKAAEKHSLYYFSPSPVYAPLIPYPWFSAIQLLWGHSGKYRKGASWIASSNVGTLGDFFLYNLSTGSLILDTAIGLFMDERTYIDEGTSLDNRRIILPKLLPTLTL